MTHEPANDSATHQHELNDLREKNRRLNLLSDFAMTLMAMSSTNAVLWYTAREVVGRMGFDDCVIYLWDNEQQRLVQAAAFGHKSPATQNIVNPLTLRLGEGVVGRAAATRETVLINDLTGDPDYVVDLQTAASELAVPIIHHDELLGVVDSESPQRDFYTDDLVKMLSAVTAMLAARLTNTRLVAQLETSVSQLQYAEKLQKTLFKIAALSFEDDDTQNIYQKIHQHVSELLYAKAFYVAIYSKARHQIEFPYFVDEDEPLLLNGAVPADTEMKGLTAWVISHKQSLLLSKAEILQMQERGEFQMMGALPESWLGVPLDTGDDLNSMVAVQSYNPAIIYGEKDRALLTFVSQQICSLLKRKDAEKKLHHQALHDALTGLSNRTLFMDRIQHALQRQLRTPGSVSAVLYMDVDRFKGINDRYGHAVGDALLIAFARTLQGLTREADTIARLGGDEFAIFIENIASDDVPCALAARIIHALEQAVAVADQVIVVGTSIGIAYLRDATLDASEIVRRADTAMYQAKAAGRGNYQCYDPEFDKAHSRGQELTEDIKTALESEQFVIYYQPIHHVSSEKAVGFEALIRWPHPDKGWIAPVDFIGHAEKSREIEKIDRYVLAKVVQQMAQWKTTAGVYPGVSVNVSGRHFASAEFIAYLLSLLDSIDLPPRTLGIEITERAVVDNFATAQANIKALQQRGVRVLLDDFGSGYSSLNYLHQLTLDVIKIDRTFVTGIRGDKKDNPIVASIVALAATMDLDVIAEGVETRDELRVLKQIGCGYCQGYHFAKALPAADALAYFLTQRAV